MVTLRFDRHNSHNPTPEIWPIAERLRCYVFDVTVSHAELMPATDQRCRPENSTRSAMLRQNTQAVSPEIQQFVDGIIDEETRARMQDRRAVGREPLCRPVDVTPFNAGGQSVSALSKDISGMGIGLVSQQPVEPRTTAKLTIYRLRGRPSVVVAECRWCEQSAGGWFLSGWYFMNVEIH